MLIKKISLEDIPYIEDCGKKCLPIYFKQKELVYIIDNDKYKLLKIFDKEIIYGFIILQIFDNKNHIMSFGIDPLYRNMGYGKALINKVKEISLNKTISLNVQKNNVIAINFYIKNGFKVKKELINYYDNLDFKDAYYMEFLN